MKFESSQTNQIAQQQLKCLKCKSCELLSFFQSSLDAHICEPKQKFNCPGCTNKFTTNESLTSHLLFDHQVRNDEVEFFFCNSVGEKPTQKIHIVDFVEKADQIKKSDPAELNQQPKSKIFIKDVTLLRKPDLLHNDIAIPNIFDSLDLTTTEDDIFDDFLDDQIFANDDFDQMDFDESANLNNFESLPTPEPVPEVEIVTPATEVIPAEPQSGKIFVRRNLCDDEVPADADEEASDNNEILTSKIYVRSHESLTSQVLTTEITQQPSEASTPDCVIVAPEAPSEAPPSKIFIRNIETLTNPQQVNVEEQFYPASNDNIFLPNNYPIYVRTYDENLGTDTRPSQASTPNETMHPQPRCKISIKNMSTLIEPILMQAPLMNPPTSMIFGQAQNLVIHMRPQQADESLLSYRDTSMTPDTLPGSSNVSVCGGNDDVIILDDTDVYAAFNNSSEIRLDDIPVQQMDPEITSLEQLENICSTSVINPQPIEPPERNETPNEKTVLQKLELTNEQPEVVKDNEEQPMVRIPIDFTEAEKAPGKKKVKIIKIIRVKRRRDGDSMKLQSSDAIKKIPHGNIQVIFKCSHADCNQHFTNGQLLKYHKKCHGTDGLIICPECLSNEFKNFMTLHTHLWRTHKVDMDLYACNLCDFKTPILSRLKNFHEKIHSDEKNFKCSFPNCEKRFKNSKQLKNHFVIHKKKKKEKVETANLKVKVTPEKPSIDENLSKRFQCGDCGKGFSSDSGLYIHSMEHKNDPKKFKCDRCDYSTNDHNSFRRHKSQHSNIHQYKCPTCDYTSIQSNTYRKHLEKQHPELAESLLFKCTICKFTTISKGKFDGHVAKHDEFQLKPNKKLVKEDQEKNL